MGGYKLGEKVCFSEPSSGSKRWDWNNEATYAGGPFYMNSASKGEVSHMLLSSAGHHFTCPDDRLRPAPPQPVWEYGHDVHLLREPSKTVWYKIVGPISTYRRQVDKPETIQYLTPKQVEELRND